METRANFVLIGAFTLAVIAGAFLFVLWFTGLTRIADRQTYAVLFDTSVAGLSQGSAVEFDGIRVGEVAKISLIAGDPPPRRSADRGHGPRADQAGHQGRLEVQGLTGGAAIALIGGAPDAPALVGKTASRRCSSPNLRDAERLQAVQTISAKADPVLTRIDKLVGDNTPAVGDAVRNLDASPRRSATTPAASIRRWPASPNWQEDRPALRPAAGLQRSRPSCHRGRSGQGAAHRRRRADVHRRLADNKAIASTLTDEAALAKRLNETSGKVNTALADFDRLVKPVGLGQGRQRRRRRYARHDLEAGPGSRSTAW